MKKFVIGISLALLLIFITLPAFAKNIQIKVDGVAIASDVVPEIINSRMMVPMRVIGEDVGANVNWSNSEVELTKGDMKVIIKLTNGTAIKNGEMVPLGVKPYIKNNRTMVPLRFLAETLGSDVNYRNFIATVNTDPLVIDGVKVKALQREYHMTMGGVIQQIIGNAYNKAIYDIFLENKGNRVEAPVSYSWMIDIDTPGAYYKMGQYDFSDLNNNTIQRFDVYGLIEAHSAETLAGYPKFLIYNVTSNEWNLFNDNAILSINQIVETATKNGFQEVINNTVV